MEAGEKILIGMIAGLVMVGTISAAAISMNSDKPTTKKEESSLSRWFDGKSK